ncbi:hypothetical protein N3K66_006897 [Trichothecium roseum]|uniref:Uncharacterized protein n=1 Tax=Trichothecium roseum TaxID=47278 RepID=A0ACC0UWN5_9HYPO|nr:hypothetical protein N3K66_006897 [Trichothecium roseum]
MSTYHGSPIPEDLPSSPPVDSSSQAGSLMSPSRSSRRKEKRNAPLTPRRFNRFFAPRSSLPARRILSDLSSSSTNRQLASPASSDIFLSSDINDSPTYRTPGSRFRKRRYLETLHEESPTKRRRGVMTDGEAEEEDEEDGGEEQEEDMEPVPLKYPDESLNHQPSGLEMISPPDDIKDPDAWRAATLSHFFKASRSQEQSAKSSPAKKTIRVSPAKCTFIEPPEDYEHRPIRQFRDQGFEARLLNREHCFSRTTVRGCPPTTDHDWRMSTSAYHSNSTDWARCVDDGGAPTIPFSLSSCRNVRNLGTVVGDESGFIHWFCKTESSSDQWHLTGSRQVHQNAIMDMDFSEDDLRLATACGDRTGQIIDTVTQTTAVNLSGGHRNSMRQVKFQPGMTNGSVLASSDRDGQVQVWDLRCSSLPTRAFSASRSKARDASLDPVDCKTSNTIEGGHKRPGQTCGASVTALQWFPGSRSHLLLTGSEADASIKLWDTRYIKRRNQPDDVPLAVTAVPPTHAWRSWGITSLALSSDSSRLFAVCKDSVVYAYSTAHLMLGDSPELSDPGWKRRPRAVAGLGPLYGMTHEGFRVPTFYTKCALRPASGSRPETLAVGSGQGSPILMPTSESHLPPASSPDSNGNGSNTSSSASEVPIYRNVGTPLVRGHSAEVTSVGWQSDGGLVTASDDHFVRRWGEDEGRARYLRTVGEFGGERYMAGWADVGDEFDEDEDGGLDDVEC